jgi:hypothetical protein
MRAMAGDANTTGSDQYRELTPCRLSREELFAAIPGPTRHKKLGKRVLGLV